MTRTALLAAALLAALAGPLPADDAPASAPATQPGQLPAAPATASATTPAADAAQDKSAPIPDGSGTGPKGLYGSGVLAPRRIIYILDHSGSMDANFDSLRTEIKAVLGGLTAAQKIGVIAVSDKVDAVFPADKTLAAATPETKRQLADFIDSLRAAGKNEDLLEPFANAFTEAVAQNPQVIYFLADGSIDPKLADKIKELNKDGKIKIHTIAFVKVSKGTEELLQNIAADNGGKYKFVKEEELGK